MPEFAPGEAKTAVAPITVSPAGLGCEVELYLGPDEATKVATSGGIPFTSTGAPQVVSFPVTMPATEGTYHVYVDVYAGGYLIAAYQAIEDVVIAPVGVQITSITVNPTSLTTARHEYETSLGLGYWGDPFTLSITFSNPFDYDVWVRPDFALGHQNAGFSAKALLYVRFLMNTAYMQGDYSYTSAWQNLWEGRGQNVGSNMRLAVDPDGLRSWGGAYYWLKIPAKGAATTVKQAHLGSDLQVQVYQWQCTLCGEIFIGDVKEHYESNHPGVEIYSWSWGGYGGWLFTDGSGAAVTSSVVYVPAEGVVGTYDIRAVAVEACYLAYDPHYITVGGVQYLVNWSPVALDPVAATKLNAITIS